MSQEKEKENNKVIYILAGAGKGAVHSRMPSMELRLLLRRRLELQGRESASESEGRMGDLL